MNRPKQRPLFVLTMKRIKGGYRAQARVATRSGYIIFCATARRHEYVVGDITDPPKAAAMKSVLDQASEFIASPQGTRMVPSLARAAITATSAVREVAERAQEGDSEARVGMAKLKRSPHKTVRKAVNAQRLFEE